MKIIRKINDLNKAVKNNDDLGFVPTMGGLHQGHKKLIRISKKRCRKIIVSIFINPTQFNNKKDYLSYPKNIYSDLKILRKLSVDFVYLPTIKQIYNKKRSTKITLKNPQKILCAKFRKGHFEGVLDVLDRFVKLITPKIIFMGEKDYQQFFLTKKFIENKYKIKVLSCKTIRDSNNVALSTRNNLLTKSNLKTCSFIANNLINLKYKINKNRNKSSILIRYLKKKLIKEYNIKIEYLECRNLLNLKTNILNNPYKIFIAYYLNNVRLIDNF
jgi:pantoate--beta-alanine ligase